MNSRKIYTLSAGPFTLELGKRTRLMGIVNATPDSFSQDGLLRGGTKSIINYAKKLINDGADVIDIGGESTRPGAKRISMKEEISRVIPAITALAKDCPIPISVDTYKTEVAQRALDAGACIVNNIMGTRPNKSLLRKVRNYNAAVVLMHIKGTPRTMQQNLRYKNLIGEITESLRNAIENCLESGIRSDRIIIDPGIGFGKSISHNLKILNHLSALKKLNKPILIGTSRKSFIGQTLHKDTADRLMGTAATVTASILNSAHIVRVHDVKPIKDVALMTDAILQEASVV